MNNESIRTQNLQNTSENENNEIQEIVDVVAEESNLRTQNEIRNYLITLYDISVPIAFNAETLNTIGTIVRNKVVRNVKFVLHEHTSGLSREGIERSRNYPSFWKPDLTNNRSIQSDIFSEFPDMADATLQYQVQAWIGMRDKVLQSIRSHRSTTQSSIQVSIVNGKFQIVMGRIRHQNTQYIYLIFYYL